MKTLTLALLFAAGLAGLGLLGVPTHCPADRPPVHVSVVLAQAPAPAPALEREAVEGIPVPIYPGTRVTEAQIEPPRPPRPPDPPDVRADEAPDEVRLARPARIKVRRPSRPSPAPAPALPSVRPETVVGPLSATEPRAVDAARVQLGRRVTEWLAPEVPASWKPPASFVDGLIAGRRIRTVEKPYGTLYEATLDVDLSPPRRAGLVAAYQRELVGHRLAVLGGGLGFVLACLAALAGYIRADEATRGYYTHWLRAVAAAGVGASGVLIYQLLT